MSVFCWSTRYPLDPDFAEAWESRLRAHPRADFSFDLLYLEWESRHGRHALAVLVCEVGRRGAFVLREVRGHFECGWPWRWQAIACDAPAPTAAALTSAQSHWLHRHAVEIVKGRQLIWFEPCGSNKGLAFHAGGTSLRRIDIGDEALLRSIDSSKRSVLRRASKLGYEVVEGGSSEQRRAFARLQRTAETRRGRRVTSDVPENPAPGESWREWELPWMWLLLAVRGGVVHAGSGFSVRAGGTMDYRANASSADGRRDGSNVLLAYEALCRGRDRGMKWINWSGNTVFKRQMGGEPLKIWCVLSGGPRWVVPNALSTAVFRTRSTLSGWRRMVARQPQASRPQPESRAHPVSRAPAPRLR